MSVQNNQQDVSLRTSASPLVESDSYSTQSSVQDEGAAVDSPQKYDIARKDSVDLANVISHSLEKLKKMLGLTPDCLNGGLKTLRGECICPKYYRGKICEEIICVNNGTLVKVSKLIPSQYACRCPHPEYIYGSHCEHVKCLNGGRPLETGRCKCLDYWYAGQFCQEYTASWGAVLGLPLTCIVIIIICCVVCRLDLFPRKPASRRHRCATIVLDGNDHRRRSANARRNVSSRHSNESSAHLQENLLNDESLALRRDGNIVPSYMIRLDTIPVFNPRLAESINVANVKPIDPPPSYDEAVSISAGYRRPVTVGTGKFQSSEFGSCASRPPPPHFPPPDIPHDS